jgi:hypothetical protein
MALHPQLTKSKALHKTRDVDQVSGTSLLHRVVGYSVANQTGDIADNQYYLYKQDIARIAAIGVKHYFVLYIVVKGDAILKGGQSTSKL